VDASLVYEEAARRAGWDALSAAVREAKVAAADANSVAATSAALARQASQAANSASALGWPHRESDGGGGGGAAAAAAVAELEARLVRGVIDPLGERLSAGIREVAQVCMCKRARAHLCRGSLGSRGAGSRDTFL
jgi:hypothetical protein